MKKFSRVRNLLEVEAAVRQRGWRWDSSKHDSEGLDHVRIDFNFAGTEGMVLFSSFNGKFLGELSDKTAFSSDNTNHDNEPWFQALLDTFYA
jgi:hypothetical protein